MRIVFVSFVYLRAFIQFTCAYWRTEFIKAFLGDNLTRNYYRRTSARRSKMASSKDRPTRGIPQQKQKIESVTLEGLVSLDNYVTFNL